jgi:hypothetical protein
MASLHSFSFVTTPDERTAFFPSGPLSVFAGAYVIHSAQVARLRRLFAIWRFISVGASILGVLLVDAVVLINNLPPRGMEQLLVWQCWLGLAFMVCYYASMPYVLHGLRPPPAKLTRRESMIVQARAHGQASLIVRMFAFFVFFAGGGVLLIFVNRIIFFDPTVWLLAATLIVIGGFGAASYAAILVVR